MVRSEPTGGPVGCRPELVTKVSDIPEAIGEKRFYLLDLIVFGWFPGSRIFLTHLPPMWIHFEFIQFARLLGCGLKPIAVREMTRSETVGSCVDIRDDSHDWAVRR